MVEDGSRPGVDAVRILGPLEVIANGRSVPVGGERQRALLGMLALRANELVTVDELVDAFFGPSGTGSLHTAISRLRRVLGAGWVETHPRGYVLRSDSAGLDAIQAREMTAQLEDPAERAHALRAAEALWRGPVLAGIDLPASFQADVARLAELHRAIVAERIEVELALGRHAELIGELDALTRANPFDERLHRARALALYRAGRQAEALSTLARYGSTLRDELGLDPSRDLRDLERAILNHDPVLTPPKPAPPDVQSAPGRRITRGPLFLALAIVLAATASVFAVVREGPDGTPLTELRPETLALVPAGSTHAERTFNVGNVPRAVTIGFGATWVADLTDQTVTRIADDGTATTTGLGVTATGLAAGGGAIWAIASDEGVVIRLEPRTGRVLGRVALRPGLTDVAAGPDSVWVTNADAGTLTQIDARRGEPVATVERLARPAGVAVAPDGIWVAERLDRRLALVDAHRAVIADRIPVDLPPGDLALMAGAVWATNQGAGTVTRVDARARTAQVISVGRLPTAVAAAGDSVYVLNDLDHSVSVLDASTGRVVRTLSLSDPVTQRPSQITPGGIAADDRGLWVTVQSY